MAKFSLTIIDQNQVHRKQLQSGERLRVCRREDADKAEKSTSLDSHLQLFQSASRTVSTNHAEFRVDGDGRVVVTDRGSTNGTWLRLIPNHEYTLPLDGEVLLGTETTVKRKHAPWEVHSEQQFATTKDFVAHLRSQFRDYIRDLRVLEVGAADVGRLDGTWSTYPLSGQQGCLAVQWKHTTVVSPVERWLRDAVLLFNCEQSSAPTELAEVGWSFLAASESRRRVLALAKRIAPKNCPLLLIGPTGAGKEVLARDIHAHSARPDKPFVAINCAALPENLLESMLFGVKAGAFTGAVESVGLLESANGGTFFFDEIGELPLSLQAKLLRVLEDYRVRRVGDTKEREVKVRIIAATHRDLPEMVATGRFREDLYFRLNALQMDLPHLGPEDVSLLTRAVLERQSATESVTLTEKEIREICALAAARKWTGNAREIRNAMWRYLALRDESLSTTENWAVAMLQPRTNELRADSAQTPTFETKTDSSESIGVAGQLEGPLVSVDGGEILPGSLLECITCIDNLLYLHLTKSIFSQQHRGALRIIGEHAGMTSAGASARLRRLRVVNANNEADMGLIESALVNERLKLAGYLPYLRSVLNM